MTRILLYLIFFSQFSHAQRLSETQVSFMKDNVIGNPINLKTLPEKPYHIDSVEFFTNIKMLLIRPSEKEKLVDAIKKDSLNILQQIATNNSFEWKDLSEEGFITKGKCRNKHSVNYSIPIVINNHYIIVYYLWSYGSTYAGASIDIWEIKNDKWEKNSSHELWMM